MKKLITLSLLSLLAGASLALAHGGPRPMFEAFDKNHDGKVTKTEAQAEAKERFAAIDQDRDGKITEAELVAHHDAMRANHTEKAGPTEKRPGHEHGDGHGKGRHGRGERFFAHMDDNDDGVVDAAEFSKGTMRHFEHMDEDGDGVVTEDELPTRGGRDGHCQHGDKDRG